MAARLLGPRTHHYAYVSSRSVYTWPNAVGIDESHPAVDGNPDDTLSDDYATTKRGSELGVLAERPDALVARAGLILGPYEDIGRLPWWLLRLHRGGKVLAPGSTTRSLQLIDARDLAQWMISSAEQRNGGVFNAVSPVGHTTIGELFDISREVTKSTAELVWFTPEEINAAGIRHGRSYPYGSRPLDRLPGCMIANLWPRPRQRRNVGPFEKRSKTHGPGAKTKGHQTNEPTAQYTASIRHARPTSSTRTETLDNNARKFGGLTNPRAALRPLRVLTITAAPRPGIERSRLLCR
jgi:hypothetical protein